MCTGDGGEYTFLYKNLHMNVDVCVRRRVCGVECLRLDQERDSDSTEIKGFEKMKKKSVRVGCSLSKRAYGSMNHSIGRRYQYVLHHQEELADEVKNREAAHARLTVMEQTIPKLHEDLKKAQAQLVQSRMEVSTCTLVSTPLLRCNPHPQPG